MFKKVFKSISKALGGKENGSAPAEPQAPAAPKAAAKAPVAEEKPKGKTPAKASPLAKVVEAPPPPKPAPEELCEITSKMSKDEIKERLAFLYRRYNRATSSLDPKLREEAEVMLDAIVTVREKVFGAL